MIKYEGFVPIGHADYGARFDAWIRSDNREPYNSFGNGSAMRVSPCALIMDCSFFARTGSIAEVAYVIPEWVKDKAYSYLDEPLKDVLRRWEETVVIK